MTRRDVRRAVATTVVALAALVAVPPASTASPTPHADARWSIQGGSGSAHARAKATSTGRVELSARTVGGRGTHGYRPRRSWATAEGSVTRSVEVTPGTYRVHVTYAGISSRRHVVGRGGRLGVRRTTTADFVSDGNGGDSGVRTKERLPRRGTATTDLVVRVYPGTRGRIVATAEVVAWTVAHGSRARARASAVVRDIRIRVTRVRGPHSYS